jgi:replicative DNA helicase
MATVHRVDSAKAAEGTATSEQPTGTPRAAGIDGAGRRAPPRPSSAAGATAATGPAARSGPTSEILDREPPKDLNAEMGVLGSLLLLPELCDEVALLLRPEDFYAPYNETIYRHMLALHEEGKRIDAVLLRSRLKQAGDFDHIGGDAYLVDLARAVPTAGNAEHYARIVQDRATLRNIIRASTGILKDAYDSALEPREMLNRAEEKIFAIHDDRWSGDVVDMHELMQEAFLRIDARLRGEHAGLETGFNDLDGLTGGLHDGELIILAARPSMGKTALATNIADHVAVDSQKCVLMVSLEMSRLELAQRMLCSRGEIKGTKFRSGMLTPDDRQKLVEASAALGQAPLFIDDTPARNVTEIAATARRLKRKHKLALIVIDYLQLIEPDNIRDPRQEQVARMARRLKTMARELKIPVLCLAQLNRQAEQQRGEHRPRLSHLRESGAIEQDADVVMFVHREEYFLTPDERNDPEKQHLKGRAEIIVAKQRNGPVGEVTLHWFQEFTRFKNAAQRPYEDFEQFMTD